jgi:CelD/BcsL family acetyltransferase involved in cellulose biosynthesis
VIAVSYHDTVNDLQALGLRTGAANSPFDRLAWFTLLAGPGGKTPLLAVARDGAEAVALPLMRERGALVPLANWYSFAWRPLASMGADVPALLEAIARDLKTQTGRVVLSALPDEDGTTRGLETAFAKAGWVTILEASDTNHVLPLAGRSYADYLTARPGQLRTTLKRKSGKVEIEIFTQFDALAWDAYEKIYANSWKPEEGAPAMLRAFAEQEGAAGRLRLGIARHDGKPIAAQFWTVENGTAYIHKLAHLEESKPLSAGTVLTAALMEHTIDRDNVSLVDFGTGNDPYKRDWMDLVRPRWRLTCLDPRKPGNWPAIVRALVKARLRRLASPQRAG